MASGETKEDMRSVGVVICIGAGVWLIAEWFNYPGIWRLLAGIAFVLFSIVRGVMLLDDEEATNGER